MYQAFLSRVEKTSQIEVNEILLKRTRGQG
jgi:hypothetical protein